MPDNTASALVDELDYIVKYGHDGHIRIFLWDVDNIVSHSKEHWHHSTTSSGAIMIFIKEWIAQIDGSVQERCNSSALAMELCLSCTNPSRYSTVAENEMRHGAYMCNDYLFDLITLSSWDNICYLRWYIRLWWYTIKILYTTPYWIIFFLTHMCRTLVLLGIMDWWKIRTSFEGKMCAMANCRYSWCWQQAVAPFIVTNEPSNKEINYGHPGISQSGPWNFD